MKHLPFAVAMLVALVSGSALAADEMTLHKLLEIAKQQPGSKVRINYDEGTAQEGTLTHIEGDVFCITEDIPFTSVDLESCYPYSIIRRIYNAQTRENAKFTPIWVSGPGLIVLDRKP